MYTYTNGLNSVYETMYGRGV
jgi:hypothetical protein